MLKVKCLQSYLSLLGVHDERQGAEGSWVMYCLDAALCSGAVGQWPDSPLMPPAPGFLSANGNSGGQGEEEELELGGGGVEGLCVDCPVPCPCRSEQSLNLSGPSGSSQLFHRCQRAVQALPSRARRTCSEQEERLLRNVVASLAQALQELSAGFRHAQGCYLRRE